MTTSNMYDFANSFLHRLVHGSMPTLAKRRCSEQHFRFRDDSPAAAAGAAQEETFERNVTKNSIVKTTSQTASPARRKTRVPDECENDEINGGADVPNASQYTTTLLPTVSSGDAVQERSECRTITTTTSHVSTQPSVRHKHIEHRRQQRQNKNDETLLVVDGFDHGVINIPLPFDENNDADVIALKMRKPLPPQKVQQSLVIVTNKVDKRR